MSTRRYVPSIGSVSTGTLRDADLLASFADELESFHYRRYAKLISEARSLLDNDPDGIASDVVNELRDALDECAPSYLYFGASEGDGADFGWWPAMDSINDLPRFADTGEAASERYSGDFAVVSDHGNVEIYTRFRNGRIVSVFGLV